MEPNSEDEQYVDLRTAFKIVWEHNFARAPTDMEFSDRDAASHRDTLRVLQQALATGNVPTSLTAVSDEAHGWLSLKDTDHPAFLIDVSKNTLTHPVADDCYASVHRVSLKRYLLQTPEERPRSTAGLEHRCFRWLVDLMQEENSDIPSKKRLQDLASLEFPGLGHRPFLKAWKKAIDETGRDDLTRPGRRPAKK